MQCIIREKLLTQALKLADVSNTYRTDSNHFVQTYFKWIEETETDLSRLRSPISIILQTEKSSLTSVMDGNLPNNIQEGKSIRKYQKVYAAQSLERISREIYTKIENIDQNFEQQNEKLCHTVALLASKEPTLFDKLKPNKQGVDYIWRLMKNTPETIPMYNYFSAKLTSTDINYLLTDIIQKTVSNNT